LKYVEKRVRIKKFLICKNPHKLEIRKTILYINNCYDD
jgi:hypothetical protein